MGICFILSLIDWQSNAGCNSENNKALCVLSLFIFSGYSINHCSSSLLSAYISICLSPPFLPF